MSTSFSAPARLWSLQSEPRDSPRSDLAGAALHPPRRRATRRAPRRRSPRGGLVPGRDRPSHPAAGQHRPDGLRAGPRRRPHRWPGDDRRGRGPAARNRGRARRQAHRHRLELRLRPRRQRRARLDGALGRARGGGSAQAASDRSAETRSSSRRSSTASSTRTVPSIRRRGPAGDPLPPAAATSSRSGIRARGHTRSRVRAAPSPPPG